LRRLRLRPRYLCSFLSRMSSVSRDHGDGDAMRDAHNEPARDTRTSAMLDACRTRLRCVAMRTYAHRRRRVRWYARNWAAGEGRGEARGYEDAHEGFLRRRAAIVIILRRLLLVARVDLGCSCARRGCLHRSLPVLASGCCWRFQWCRWWSWRGCCWQSHARPCGGGGRELVTPGTGAGVRRSRGNSSVTGRLFPSYRLEERRREARSVHS
jgi:hypothetical protein